MKGNEANAAAMRNCIYSCNNWQWKWNWERAMRMGMEWLGMELLLQQRSAVAITVELLMATGVVAALKSHLSATFKM